MNALTQPAPRPSIMHSVNQTVGAVVIGGDYQGLGIVRSLGRRGIPVCVVDDEHSISRFSRYCTQFVKLPDLHDQRRAVDSLLELGRGLVWKVGFSTQPEKNLLPPYRCTVRNSAKCSEFPHPIGKA